MITSYSKESGLVEGVKDTFSGAKPCDLCCKVAEAKRSDTQNGGDKPTVPKPSVKMPDCIASGSEFEIVTDSVPVTPVGFASPVIVAGVGDGSPPSPPPKRRS